MSLRYISARIKNRIDTKENLEKNNPLLYKGELCIETDTNKMKCGDGATRWNNLKYLSGGITTGCVIPFAGKIIPDDFLLCDGREVSRAIYKDLYECIGNAYGSGNGMDTFNLPNLQQRFIMGTTSEMTLNKIVDAGLPNIYGQFFVNASHDWNTNLTWPSKSPTGPFFMQDSPTSCQNWDYNRSQWVNGIGYIGFDASRANSIYGKSTTVQPPAICLYYIIKT